MPNISMNTIAAKGKKADVVNWLSIGLPEIKADMTRSAIDMMLCETNLTLASFDPQADPDEHFDAISLGAWMVEEPGEDLVVFFECRTAWNWPHDWLETMQTRYPDLTFFCLAMEDMGGFNGYFCMRDPDMWVNHFEGVESADDVDLDDAEFCDYYDDDFAVDFSGEFEDYVLDYRPEDHTYISPLERKQSEEKAEALCIEARSLSENRQFEEAEKNYAEALAIYRRLDFLNPQAMGLALNYFTVAYLLQNMADMQYNMQRFEDAEKNFAKSLSIWRKLAILKPSSYSDELKNAIQWLANAQRKLQRDEEAEKTMKEIESIECRQAALKANSECESAMLQHGAKQYEEAEKNFTEVLPTYRQLAELDPEEYLPKLALVLCRLAATQCNLNRTEEAEKNYAEALVVSHQLMGSNIKHSLALAMSFMNLGSTLNNLQRYEEAEKSNSIALRFFRQLPESKQEDDNKVEIYVALARSQSKLHHYEEAEKSFMQAVDVFRQNAFLSHCHKNVLAMILNELADAQYELHHYEDAKTNFSEALALYESCEAKNPGKYARAIETIKQRLSELN